MYQLLIRTLMGHELVYVEEISYISKFPTYRNFLHIEISYISNMLVADHFMDFFITRIGTFLFNKNISQRFRPRHALTLEDINRIKIRKINIAMMTNDVSFNLKPPWRGSSFSVYLTQKNDETGGNDMNSVKMSILLGAVALSFL